MKRPELLAPAGNLEKLKMAILYGADAVYIGGQQFGLRSRAGNFTVEAMQEGVRFAHERGKKVYVAANMVTHEGDLEGAGPFFQTLRDLGIDAVIVSDPALIEICMMEAPGLPVHLSTQASATNSETLRFWHEEGLERVVLAREVSLDEIKRMKRETDIEIETFIHGAMCIAYSGRCTLSNHMTGRDANRGGCAQSCRWQYELLENGVAYSEETPFSMSAVDLSMVRHLPDLIEAGVDSLKIEGRMKSIHYVATVCNVYRRVIDAYFENPNAFTFNPMWEEEIAKVAQRDVATGFYYERPSETAQLYGEVRSRAEYVFAARVLAYDESTGMATFEQRNHIACGDEIEIVGPGMRAFRQVIEHMTDASHSPIDVAEKAMMTFHVRVNERVVVNDIVRKRIRR